MEGFWGVDLECVEPKIHTMGPTWPFKGNGDYVVGISIFNRERNFKGYYPIGHKEGNLPIETVKRWLKKQVGNPRLTIRAFNRLHDEGWFRTLGIYPKDIKCKWFDSLTAAPLIDETRRSYQLETLAHDWLGAKKLKGSLRDAQRYLRLIGKREKLNWGKLAEMPPAYAAEYAESDAELHYDLGAYCEDQIEKLDLHQIFDLEQRLVVPLLNARELGVRVDLNRAEELRGKIDRAIKSIVAEIKRQTGHEVSLTTPASMAAVLKERGLELPKTEKTLENIAKGIEAPEIDSVAKNWLAQQDDPICRLILKGKRLSTCKSMFIDGHILGHTYRGRIHCEINPLKKELGTGTIARTSSNNPNLQNLPARDQEDSGETIYAELEDETITYPQMIRGLFLPEEGASWCASDYAGQEPRLAVHFAQKLRIPGIAQVVKEFRENPRTNFHALGARLTGLPKSQAKCVTLGFMYEMGSGKLARSLHLPTVWIETKHGTREMGGPEAQAIFKQYQQGLPWVKKLRDIVVEKAEERGWIKTLCRRLLHFNIGPDCGFPNAGFPYKALNRLIQGSAADQLKEAFIALDNAGCQLHVAVHDENGFSCESKSKASEYQEIMEHCIKLEIPVACDLEMGTNWGTSMIKAA